MTPELIATHARCYCARGRFSLNVGLQHCLRAADTFQDREIFSAPRRKLARPRHSLRQAVSGLFDTQKAQTLSGQLPRLNRQTISTSCSASENTKHWLKSRCPKMPISTPVTTGCTCRARKSCSKSCRNGPEIWVKPMRQTPVIPTPNPVIPAPNPVIPAQAGIHPFPRQTGFPPARE